MPPHPRGAHRGGRRAVLVHFDLEVEQEADGLLLHRFHHRGEHVEALALVLDEGVALRHRAQPDALLQVVHLVQVLAPLAVEHRHDHAALELAEHLRAEILLALVIGGLRVGDEFLEQVLAGQVGLLAAGLLDRLVDGERDRIERLERGPQLVEIPLLRVSGSGGTLDVTRDDVVDHGADLVGQVGALEDPRRSS